MKLEAIKVHLDGVRDACKETDKILTVLLLAKAVHNSIYKSMYGDLSVSPMLAARLGDALKALEETGE